MNPATEELLGEFPADLGAGLESRLQQVQNTIPTWRKTTLDARAGLLRQLGQQLRSKRDSLALLITQEMGKPIAPARAEIEKCAVLCDYYGEHGPAALAPIPVSGNAAQQSWIRFDPIGAVLAVMPWNYPFWQVFRFAVPTLLAGNVGVLKHASNVLGCATEIERLFLAAGFPPGCLVSLNLDRKGIPDIIGRDFVRAITLTGSEKAGVAVAEAAGRQLKKCVLELGGSDPFIVLADADVPRAVGQAVTSRIQNNGQSCIAAKRFIVEAAVYQDFVDSMTEAMRGLQLGDPSEESTQIGPLARRDLRETLHLQVRSTLKQGAMLCTGGKPLDRKGWYYQPTVLSDLEPGMTAFQEETFGPVAAVISASSPEEAIALANRSSYGLGSSLWTQDLDRAHELAAQLEAGSVFINDYTKSDPTLPFGGVKKSGYGRELGEFGIREFVNIKTVWVGRPAAQPR